jgi:hypothetical protein
MKWATHRSVLMAVGLSGALAAGRFVGMIVHTVPL